MAMTSVDLPEELVAQAMHALGAKTKREAITSALEDVVRRSRQRDALDDLQQMSFAVDLLDPEVRAQARR